jgi:SAM-dependent methyltransferase
MKFKTMPLAYKYCLGTGIELGAAVHNPFDLPDCRFVATCDGVNYLHPQDLRDYEFYKQNQIDLANEVAPVHLIGDFQKIDVPDGSFDYVISSHVIEHVPNLIAALVESARVLKNGGVFFCLFPKRNADSGDVTRALTSLDQHIDNYRKNITMSDMPLDTWRGNYQVFSLQSMIAVVNYINAQGIGNWIIESVEETDSKVGNGHTIVLRKFDALAEMRWDDSRANNNIVNQLIERGEFSPALSMLKAALSYQFKDAAKLYVAALLSMRTGNAQEGLEFLQQALIVDPENAHYRQEFAKHTGRAYANPTQ